MSQTIRVQGARVHNLKNLSVEITSRPVGSLHRPVRIGQVVTGLRHHLRRGTAPLRREPLLLRPPVPRSDGEARRRFHRGALPAISIDQKSASRNPRSTVGTITEIHDYMRLLFARIGLPHCPNCGRAVTRQTSQQIVDQVLAREAGRDSWCWRPSSKGARVSTAPCSTSWPPGLLARAR